MARLSKRSFVEIVDVATESARARSLSVVSWRRTLDGDRALLSDVLRQAGAAEDSEE